MLVTDRLLQDDMLLPRYLGDVPATWKQRESSVSFNPLFCALSPLHLLPNVAKQEPVLPEVRSEGFQTHSNPLFQSLHVPCSLALPWQPAKLPRSLPSSGTWERMASHVERQRERERGRVLRGGGWGEEGRKGRRGEEQDEKENK